MDYEADFLQTVQDAIAKLQSRHKPPISVTCRGKTYVGWEIHSVSRDRSQAGEAWTSHTRTLLTATGSLIEVEHETTTYPGMAIPPEVFESAREVPTAELVGRRGKPFSEWKSKLERLPYL